MKMQRATDHAVHILQHLHAAHIAGGHEAQTAMTISQAVGITYPYFIKLAHALKKSGLIEAVQGRKGGYSLAKSAHQISVYDVLQAIEGDVMLSPTAQGEETPRKQGRRERHGWEKFLLRVQALAVHEMKMQSIQDLGDNWAMVSDAKGAPSAPTVEMAEERRYQICTLDKQEHWVLFDQICLFQSGVRSNTIEVHTTQGVYQIRGQISRIAKIGAEFFAVHQSYTVNVNHVQHVDCDRKEVVLSNGDIVPIASTKVRALLGLLPVT